jgi:hypothetical protein
MPSFILQHTDAMTSCTVQRDPLRQRCDNLLVIHNSVTTPLEQPAHGNGNEHNRTTTN